MQDEENILEQNTTQESEAPKKKIRPSKRFIVGAVILTAIVLLIVIAAFLLANVNRRPNYGLYVKNGALYFTDFKEPPFLVTANLTATDNLLPYVDYDLRNCAILSDNGNYLFFPENMKISGDDVQTFDLCYQYISKDERETVVIARNVKQFNVSSDAMTITYLTASENSLYQYELKPAESTLVSKNVYYYQVSETSNRMVFLTGSNQLFAQAAGNPKVKIDNMVDEVLYVSGDYKTVIYRQESSLHKWVSGKGESEICADAINWTIYDSGEALLLSNQEGYSQLFYYDGQESALVMDHVEQLICTAENAPVALLRAPVPEDPEQEEAAQPQSAPPIKTFLISKNDIYEPELEGLRCVGMTSDGIRSYYVSDADPYSSLYMLNIGTFGVEDLQIFDTDVYTQNITVTGNDRVVYYKEVDEQAQVGTLYLNTAELNDNVPLQITHFQTLSDLPVSSQIYYFTDYNAEKQSGVLHVAGTDGINKPLSNKATSPFMLPNGQIMFMENYSEALKTGDLYVYTSGSIILIDSGVTFFIPVM